MASIKDLILSDLYRVSGSRNLRSFFFFYFRFPGFKYMFWFRLASYFRIQYKLFYPLFWLKLRRLQFKYGFDIPAGSMISKGFYIGHFGGIVISGKAIIGENCNISQGVTIGYNPRGEKQGCPIIGNNVYIGPGAKIIGNIKIGNNVAIGANSVVVDDVLDNSVVAGIPAKVINSKGSEGYILNKI